MLCVGCGSWGDLCQFALIRSYKADVIAVMCAIYEPIISWSSVTRNIPAIKWHVDAGLGHWGFSRIVSRQRDGSPYVWLGKCGCNLPHFNASFWHSVTRGLDGRVVLLLLLKVSSKFPRLLKKEKRTHHETISPFLLKRLHLLNIPLVRPVHLYFYGAILLCTN